MPMIDLPSRYGAEFAGRDLLHILGVMRWPSSPEKVLEFCYRSALDDILPQLTNDSSVPGDIARDLVGHESPRVKLWGEFTADRVAFLSTGYVLRWIVSRSMRESTRNAASLNKAAGVVQEWLVSKKLSGGEDSATVKRYWWEYQSVSHLWAAWQILGQAGIDHGTPNGFRRFIATSQWLLDQGSLIVPLRARPGEFVLSKDDAWQVSADFPGAMEAIIWPDDPDAHDIRKLPAPDWCKTE